jgi:dihydroneopterin aldolase
MKVTITLERMTFHTSHGVTEEERRIGGIFVAEISYTFHTNATDTDRLEETINYADLYNLVKDEMMTPSHLIEHLAARITKAIKAHYPQIQELIIKISKLNPPINGEIASASVTLKEP